MEQSTTRCVLRTTEPKKQSNHVRCAMLYTYLYSYVILTAGGILGYRGAEPALGVIVLLASVLTLPVVIKGRRDQALALTAAVSAVNALLFAAVSYGTGRGIAWLAAA